MPKTVIGLLDNDGEAHSVVRELTQHGFSRERIGLMASDPGSARPGEVKERSVNEEATASGAIKGAGTGAAVGGLAGLALALVPIVIPGIGPFIAAGPIAAALGGAGLGAVAGGLIGGLTRMGVPEEEAHYYAEGVRRGGTLVTVAVHADTEAEKALSVMKRHGAVDIEQRAAGWKREGWSGRFGSEQQAASRATAADDTVREEGERAGIHWRGTERRQPGSAAYRGTERRVLH